MSILRFIEHSKKIAEKIPNGNNWVKELYLPIRKENIKCLNLKTVIDLFDCYDLSRLQIGPINFYKSIEHTKNHDFFGFDDTYLIGINNLTGEVDYVDSYTNEIVYKLAPNLDVFLLILLAIGSYSLKGLLLGSTYSKNDRKLLLKKISDLLNDKKYLDYYSMLYGEDYDLTASSGSLSDDT